MSCSTMFIFGCWHNKRITNLNSTFPYKRPMTRGLLCEDVDVRILNTKLYLLTYSNSELSTGHFSWTRPDPAKP